MLDLDFVYYDEINKVYCLGFIDSKTGNPLKRRYTVNYMFVHYPESLAIILSMVKIPIVSPWNWDQFFYSELLFIYNDFMNNDQEIHFSHKSSKANV